MTVRKQEKSTATQSKRDRAVLVRFTAGEIAQLEKARLARGAATQCEVALAPFVRSLALKALE